MFSFAACVTNHERAFALGATWLGACAWSISLLGAGTFVTVDGLNRNLQLEYPQDRNEIALVLVAVQSAVHFAAARAGMAIAANQGRVAQRRIKYEEPLAYAPSVVPSPLCYLGARFGASAMDCLLFLSTLFQSEEGGGVRYDLASALGVPTAGIEAAKHAESQLHKICTNAITNLDYVQTDLSLASSKGQAPNQTSSQDHATRWQMQSCRSGGVPMAAWSACAVAAGFGFLALILSFFVTAFHYV